MEGGNANQNFPGKLPLIRQPSLTPSPQGEGFVQTNSKRQNLFLGGKENNR